MKRSRVLLALGIAGVLGLGSGCETIGKRHGIPGDSPAAMDDAAPPSTLPGSASPTASRSPGAWSSEAQSIEKGMTNRSANPNW